MRGDPRLVLRPPGFWGVRGAKNGFCLLRLLAIFEASCGWGSCGVAIPGRGGREAPPSAPARRRLVPGRAARARCLRDAARGSRAAASPAVGGGAEAAAESEVTWCVSMESHRRFFQALFHRPPSNPRLSTSSPTSTSASTRSPPYSVPTSLWWRHGSLARSWMRRRSDVLRERLALRRLDVISVPFRLPSSRQ